MTRAELKAAANEQIHGKIGTFFLMGLIVFGVSLICSFIPLVGSLISLVVTPAFSLSLCMFFLKLTKGEETSVGDLYALLITRKAPVKKAPKKEAVKEVKEVKTVGIGTDLPVHLL